VVYATIKRDYMQQNCAPNERWTDFGCVPDDPVGFVQQFYSIGLGILGMVAFLFLIIGGYFILTSQGNPDRVQKGREYILYSILGLILGVFGFVFFEIITGDLLQLPGFS
jgi:glucose uptake protein GlcU